MGLFQRLFGTPVPVATILPPEKPKSGFFSTDHAQPRGSQDLTTWYSQQERQVFQRTVANLRAVAGTANGKIQFATDSAEDLDGGSIKGIYSLQGYGMSDVQASWYAAQSFIGYQMCAVLAQQWLVDKACTMPAKDATRNGYEIGSVEGVVLPDGALADLKKLDKRYKVKANCREFVRHCRIYGIRIMLFKVRSADPKYYEKPFNLDGVTPGSYEGMSQVDPYWITPELDAEAAADPSSPHFYEPTWWRINGIRYHRSHLVIIRTCDVPDVLKPTYFYGGIPLPQRIYERVYAAERTANEAPQLALTKRSTLIHVDLAQATANQAKMEDRLATWAYFRDNYGVKILGTEETAEQFDTALGDMDELIMTQYQLVCSIAEVPATKMMGVQPKGFNSTGDYEEASYHEMLESIQEHDVLPVIERHHQLCIRSVICPKYGIEPFETVITFNDLDAETATEKSDRQFKDSQTAKNYADTGALDGYDIRDRLIKDKDSGFNFISAVIPEDSPHPIKVTNPEGQAAKPVPAAPAAAPPSAT